MIYNHTCCQRLGLRLYLCHLLSESAVALLMKRRRPVRGIYEALTYLMEPPPHANSVVYKKTLLCDALFISPIKSTSRSIKGERLRLRDRFNFSNLTVPKYLSQFIHHSCFNKSQQRCLSSYVANPPPPPHLLLQAD